MQLSIVFVYFVDERERRRKRFFVFYFYFRFFSLLHALALLHAQRHNEKTVPLSLPALSLNTLRAKKKKGECFAFSLEDHKFGVRKLLRATSKTSRCACDPGSQGSWWLNSLTVAAPRPFPFFFLVLISKSFRLYTQHKLIITFSRGRKGPTPGERACKCMFHLLLQNREEEEEEKLRENKLSLSLQVELERKTELSLSLSVRW